MRLINSFENEKETCLLLLEKAIAKYLHGYSQTQNVDFKWWLQLLTGAAVRCERTTQWQKLRADLASDHIVALRARKSSQRVGLDGFYAVLATQ